MLKLIGLGLAAFALWVIGAIFWSAMVVIVTGSEATMFGAIAAGTIFALLVLALCLRTTFRER